MSGEFELTEEQRHAIAEFRRHSRTALVALLFADVRHGLRLSSAERPGGVAESPGGEAAPGQTSERHSMAAGVLATFEKAQEIPASAGLFSAVFAYPSNAVLFALRLQTLLRSGAEAADPASGARIGIHAATILGKEERGVEPKHDALGRNAAIAWRLMAMAQPDQILMTTAAFDKARRLFKSDALEGLGPLSWLSYGLFAVTDVKDPIELCEVGETGPARLTEPSDSDYGQDVFSRDQGPVAGWRPAVQQLVRGTEWVIEEALGYSDFGETWRARHRQSGEAHVFKFCFRAEQVRSIRPETARLRVVKDALSKRPDVVRLYGFEFQEPPAYLEVEHVAGKDLSEWIAQRGGFEAVPMELRLGIMAQAAEAIGAAHQLGVIHKGIKPSNILVEERADGSVQARVADFLVGGAVAPEAALAESADGEKKSLYLAPELMAGGPHTVASDLYALGVLLYHMLVSDFGQLVPSEWQHISDPVLRKDLRQLTASNPAKRRVGAAELAVHLRHPSRQRVVHYASRTAGVVTAVLLVISVCVGAISFLVNTIRPKPTYQPPPPPPVSRAVATPVTFTGPSVYTPLPVPAGLAALGVVEGPILAFDSFDRKLGLDWEILRPDKSHYSLTKTSGALTITTQAGFFSRADSDYKNLFLLDWPTTESKDLQVTICISSFRPTANFNQAGLIFFNDEDNWLKWVYIWADRREFTILGETAGQWPAESRAAYSVSSTPNKVWLRVSKVGRQYCVSSSTDGRTFTTHGTRSWGDGNVKQVGFYAMNGSGSQAPEIDAVIESFEARSLMPVRPYLRVASAASRRYAIADQALAIPDDMQDCAENMRKIFVAIKRYEKDKGDIPNWLSDLVPNYLTTQTLRCDKDTTGTSTFYPDPKTSCSYTYEFSAFPINRPDAKTCKAWKTQQVGQYGDVVPIIRCQHHGAASVLNISVIGQVYTSGLNWESMFSVPIATTTVWQPGAVTPEPYAGPARPPDPKQLETCAGNLLAIHAALVEYRSKNNGQMPGSLGDLAPQYLHMSKLLCPVNPAGVNVVSQNPPLRSSYCYQFARPSGAQTGQSLRDTRERQLKEFGDLVPTVHCHHHGQFFLHVSWAGNLFLGVSAWDTAQLVDRGTTITGSLCIISARGRHRSNPDRGDPATSPTVVSVPAKGSRAELDALVREFWTTEGPRAQWEKLPEIASRIADHPSADGTFLNNLAWEIIDVYRLHPEATLTLARAAIRKQPNAGHILDTVGWAELMAGNNAEAVKFFEQAIPREQAFQQGTSLSGMAIALARLGQIDRAWDSLWRAAEIKETHRQHLLEAYAEVAKSGAPKDSAVRQRVRQAAGGISPAPEVGFAPAKPRAGEKVKLLYRPYLTDQANADRMIIHWGLNRWADQGEEAARAKDARRTFWTGTNRVSGIQQPMAREGAAWAVTIALPPTARQMDLTFYAQSPSGNWSPRGRYFHITVTAAGATDDSATTRPVGRTQEDQP